MNLPQSINNLLALFHQSHILSMDESKNDKLCSSISRHNCTVSSPLIYVMDKQII